MPYIIKGRVMLNSQGIYPAVVNIVAQDYAEYPLAYGMKHSILANATQTTTNRALACDSTHMYTGSHTMYKIAKYNITTGELVATSAFSTTGSGIADILVDATHVYAICTSNWVYKLLKSDLSHVATSSNALITGWGANMKDAGTFIYFGAGTYLYRLTKSTLSLSSLNMWYSVGCVDSDSTYIYIGYSANNGTIARYLISSMQVVTPDLTGFDDVGGSDPRSMCRVGTDLYVGAGYKVAKINLSTWAISSRVAIVGGTYSQLNNLYGMVADSEHLYVANIPNISFAVAHIYKISLSTFTIVNMSTGFLPDAVYANPWYLQIQGDYLYLTGTLWGRYIQRFDKFFLSNGTVTDVNGYYENKYYFFGGIPLAAGAKYTVTVRYTNDDSEVVTAALP